MNKKKNSTLPQNGEIIIYQSPDGNTRLDVRLVNDTIWLSIEQMAKLFDVDKSGISRHLKNVFEEGELSKKGTVAKFATVQQEGERRVARNIEFYNLDAIISVGYRVNSIRGTQFRIWATQRLKEYLIKGFAMDDERLKNPPVGNSEAPDYFDEMLERIRDIRASERRMYLRVREIFSFAADYRIGYKETTQFYSFIQDKLHFAATGMTSAELMVKRANHLLPNMGLTSSKSGEVRKSDVSIGKNYLREDEIAELNLIVSMWLDFAEDQAKRRKQVFLKDWSEKLDAFLKFNGRQVLNHHGQVSRIDAENYVANEYEIFSKQRRTLKEAEGEKELFGALEELAKKVCKTPKDD